MAKVVPAKLGATSAWLLRWPAELQALRAIDIVTQLQYKSAMRYINVIEGQLDGDNTLANQC